MKKPHVKMRLFKSGEESKIVNFSNSLTETNHTVSGWIWEYKKNPINKNCFCLAFGGDRIIGSQALIPIKLIHNNKIIISGKSEATLLDPKFRGMGLCTAMYIYIHKKCQGIKITWGFTSAEKPLRKAGFAIKGPVRVSFTPLTFSGSLSYFFQNNIIANSSFQNYIHFVALMIIMIYACLKNKLRDIYNSIITRNEKLVTIVEHRFDEVNFDEYVNPFLEYLPEVTTVHRDNRFMKWWVSENPYVKHEIYTINLGNERIGYLIFYFKESTVYLRDMVIVRKPSKKEAAYINSWIRNYFKDRSYSILFNQIFHTQNRYYMSYIFPILKGSFIQFRKGSLVVLYSQSSECNMLYDLNKWYITGLGFEVQ